MKKYSLFLISFLIISVNLNSQSFQWAKKIDTKFTNSFYSSNMKLDGQNNIIIAGLFKETTDFDLGAGVYTLTPTPGNFDIFIAKYSPNGSFIWAKKIGCNTYAQFWDFTIDKNDNIIISALVNDVVDVDPSSANTSVGAIGTQISFLAKYNSTGNFMWVDTFSPNGIFSKIRSDAQGRIIAAGNMYQTVDFNPDAATSIVTAPGNANYLFIAMYTSTGKLSWVKTMGDATNFSEDLYELHLDTLNNIIIGGRFNGVIDMDPSAGISTLNSLNKYVGFFAKYTPTGQFVFARSFNATGNSQVRNIRTDKKGSIILSGRFSGTMDLDASTAVFNVSATATNDIFLTKYSSTGTMQWGFDFGNASEEILANHEVSPNGNIYVYGRFKGVVDFDPSTAVYNLSTIPASKTDLFLVTYDSLGALKTALRLGNNKSEDPIALTLNKNNAEVCLFGNFAGTTDFDFSTNTNNLVATDQDFFIVKYSFAPTNFKIANEKKSPDEIFVSKPEETITWVVFPNPVVNQLNIKVSAEVKIESIKIYNTAGNNVLSFSNNEVDYDSSVFTVNMGTLPSGVYVVSVNNNQFSKLVIKQ